MVKGCWKCSHCSYANNWPSRQSCYQCRRERPKSGDGPQRRGGMLSDEAFRALARIYTCAELLGLWPSQQCFLAVQMLDKPKGGYRLI